MPFGWGNKKKSNENVEYDEFNGQNSSNSSGLINATQRKNMATARYELEGITALFNKMAETCAFKCLSKKYSDAELQMGELTCSDRCVVNICKHKVK